MINNVTVRRMTPADPEPIAAAFRKLGWDKPVEQYLGYLAEQQAGRRICFVADRAGDFAGYGTLLWNSSYDPFRSQGIPEISDLNVLPHHRRQGIGTRLLDALEDAARQRCRTVGIGVGLDADYGPAQRLYLHRGYLPDGNGVVYHNKPVPWGSVITLDDDAALMLTRRLPG